MPQTTPMIVVIDDDASVRRALQRLLRSAGLAVETFATAREFLAAGQLAKTACLILDIHLAGMSGFDMQKYLVTSGAAIPIIFITAHDDVLTRERASNADAVDHLRKPFDDEALIEAIGKAMSQGSAKRGAPESLQIGGNTRIRRCLDA
jgi:FixJ family two-component response regulator